MTGDPRDDLADLMEDTIYGQMTSSGLDERRAAYWLPIADALIAAGYVKPKPPTVYPDHDIDVERAAVCDTCDRFIAWAGETQGWVHL